MPEKKDYYKRSIIKHLYFSNTLSCADLSEKLEKSLPLTTRLVQELVKDDYINDQGFAPSSGGRRPVAYALKPDVLFIVAIAMDQFVTRIVIMDMHNRYITEVEKFELNIEKSIGPLSILTDKINTHIDKSGIAPSKIAGIGIGMPGFIDSAKGINYSFFNQANIPDYISKKTGLDVFIDNDSSLIALAELRFGKARNSTTAMVINIGWGVGLGLIINKSLFRGYNGFAGEFSHISLFNNEKLCGVCGKMGCLETETSLSVIVDKARLSLQGGKTSVLKEQVFNIDIETAFARIMKAAQKGDQLAVELFSEAGYNIGRGVAILIHLLNPQIIVLSGRGSLAGKIWQAPIQQALNHHCIPRLADNTNIEISSFGYEAELIGSAALVMEKYVLSHSGDSMAIGEENNYYTKNN